MNGQAVMGSAESNRVDPSRGSAGRQQTIDPYEQSNLIKNNTQGNSQIMETAPASYPYNDRNSASQPPFRQGNWFNSEQEIY